VGSIALGEHGRMIAATAAGLQTFDPGNGSLKPISNPEAHLPDNRFNDGACDARGRFWAGSMDDMEAAPTGDLYRLDPDGQVKRFQAGFVITNGIRWTADGKKLYVVDSAARTIWEHAFDLEKGLPGTRRIFAKLAEEDGWPDGLCVDAENHVWGAHWGAGRITRYRPDGTIERTIAFLAPNVTSCCFGGPDFETLFVTTARIGLSEGQLALNPLSGGLFAVTDLGIRGFAANRFAG
jgi:sugar lactone lactonase YvrE